jgi:hypothetical protein
MFTGKFKKNKNVFKKVAHSRATFCVSACMGEGSDAMQQDNGAKTLKERIRSGQIRREDVIRRLAELAFGKANDCVRLALEDAPELNRLDLSLLSEVKRNEKGTVEIRLIDRLRALEQLAQAAGEDNRGAEEFLRALAEGGSEP